MFLIEALLKWFGGPAAAEAAREAGWIAFAWKVFALALGAGFYRFVAVSGLLLIGALVWMHRRQEGMFADFRLTRLIGAIPLLVVSVVTLGAFLGAVSESVAAAVEAHRRLAHPPVLRDASASASFLAPPAPRRGP